MSIFFSPFPNFQKHLQALRRMYHLLRKLFDLTLLRCVIKCRKGPWGLQFIACYYFTRPLSTTFPWITSLEMLWRMSTHFLPGDITKERMKKKKTNSPRLSPLSIFLPSFLLILPMVQIQEQQDIYALPRVKGFFGYSYAYKVDKQMQFSFRLPLKILS